MEKNRQEALIDESLVNVNATNTPVKDYLIQFLPKMTKDMARHRMSEKDFIMVYKRAEKEEQAGNGTVTEQFISLTEQYLSLQAISSFERKSVDVKILEEVVRRWARQFGFSQKDIIVKEIENRVVSISFKSGEPRTLYEQAMVIVKQGKSGGSEKILRYLIREASEFGYESQYDGIGNIICKK